MAKAWVQCSDGSQIKVECSNRRRGNASEGLSLGVVPLIADVIVTTAESPVAPGGRINIFYSPIVGAAEGDPVVLNPVPGETPGDELYGLTIGPACMATPSGLRMYLQNRTPDPIVIADDFHVRACVLHILPELPE